MFSKYFTGFGFFFFSIFLFNIMSAEGFVAGTQVLIEKDGVVGFEEIQNIKCGDLCFSQNLDTGYLEPVKVLKNKKFKKKVLKFKTSSGVEFIVAADYQFCVPINYRFFVPNAFNQALEVDWQVAKEFAPGDFLACAGQRESFVQVRSVEPLVWQQSTYCLSLEKNHNYFISKAKIIVHNVAFFLGVSFAFEGASVTLTKVCANLLFGGILWRIACNSRNSSSSSSSSFIPGCDDLKLDVSAKVPVSGGGGSTSSSAPSSPPPGGPKPPKKDDEDEKECSIKKCQEEKDAAKREVERAKNAQDRAENRAEREANRADRAENNRERLEDQLDLKDQELRDLNNRYEEYKKSSESSSDSSFIDWLKAVGKGWLACKAADRSLDYVEGKFSGKKNKDEDQK